MNLQAYQQGAAMGSAGANAAIDEWADHAERLKGRLQDATEKADELAKQRLFADAQVEGLRAVIAAMEHEIQRLKPDSSLLHPSTKKNIAAQQMAKFLMPHGYLYDLENYKVSKISR